MPNEVVETINELANLGVATKHILYAYRCICNVSKNVSVSVLNV